MKKLISILAAAILLSSCGGKMTLLKRHYTKGFYVQSSSRVETPKTYASRAGKKVEILKPVLVSLSAGAKAPELTASIKPVPQALTSVKPGAKATFDASTVSLQKDLPALEARKQLVRQAALKKGQGGGNTNIVLLVILSLFPILALVAMYLHDGNQVTANFWVDLILHITIIGYAIFALLVVFGIVDLA